MKQLVEEREAAASPDSAALADVSSDATRRDLSGELGFMDPPRAILSSSEMLGGEGVPAPPQRPCKAVLAV